jgi:hypothetical protein
VASAGAARDRATKLAAGAWSGRASYSVGRTLVTSLPPPSWLTRCSPASGELRGSRLPRVLGDHFRRGAHFSHDRRAVCPFPHSALTASIKSHRVTSCAGRSDPARRGQTRPAGTPACVSFLSRERRPDMKPPPDTAWAVAGSAQTLNYHCHTTPGPLPEPSVVPGVLGGLSAAASRLPQILSQPGSADRERPRPQRQNPRPLQRAKHLRGDRRPAPGRPGYRGVRRCARRGLGRKPVAALNAS